MSEKLAFRNISGTNHFFGELNNRRVTFDEDKKIYFTQKEIDSCESLRDLIKQGSLVRWEENSDSDIPSANFDSPHFPSEPQPEISGNIASFGDIEEIGSEFDPDPDQILPDTPPPKEIPPKDITEVWWTGPSSDAGGYGKMNRECLVRLHEKRDLKISHELAGLGGIAGARAKLKSSPALEEMLTNKVGDDATAVWAIMPPKFLPRRGRKILFTMMECNAVPPGFAVKCQNADELWLPSKHNMKIFEEANISVPKYHIPLGVDTDLYRPFDLNSEQKKKLGFKTKSFIFMSLFGWSMRKGCDALFRAYLETFTAKDDVSLVVVSRLWGRSTPEDINEIRKTIANYIKKYAKNTDKPPHIVHVGEAVPEDDLPLLYNSANAFVLSTRGEGFGLPYLEAGACEIPVIATRCTGQLDYLNDDNSYLVDIEGYDSSSQEIKEILKTSSYYEGMPFAVIGEKGIKQLKEQMRHVYENESEAKLKAKKLRKDIEENFTWDHVVDRIYERLKS